MDPPDGTYIGADMEYVVIGPFRIWHIGGMVIGLIMAIIICVCCCKDIRIPRTKQEIEANHQRRKLHSKIPDRFFHLNTDGYKLFIDQVQSQKPKQKHTSEDKRGQNNLLYTNNKCTHQVSKETKIKWKAVTQSLKSITEEVPFGNTLATVLKDSKGFQQRPSQHNISNTLNSLVSEIQKT